MNPGPRTFGTPSTGHPEGYTQMFDQLVHKAHVDELVKLSCSLQVSVVFYSNWWIHETYVFEEESSMIRLGTCSGGKIIFFSNKMFKYLFFLSLCTLISHIMGGGWSYAVSRSRYGLVLSISPLTMSWFFSFTLPLHCMQTANTHQPSQLLQCCSGSFHSSFFISFVFLLCHHLSSLTSLLFIDGWQTAKLVKLDYAWITMNWNIIWT